MNVPARVRSLRRRLLAERTTTWAARAALIAAPLWAAGWIGAGPKVGLAELLACAGVAALLAWRSSKDAAATAAHVDQALNLDDRVLTAWSTGGDPASDPSPMALLVHADAAKAWEIADPSPLKARWPWAAALGVVVIAAAAATYHQRMPGGTEGVLTTFRPPPAAGPGAQPGDGPGAPADGAAPASAGADKRTTRFRARPATSGSSAPAEASAPPSLSSALPRAPSAPTAGLTLGAAASAASPEGGSPPGAAPGQAGAAIGTAREALPDLPERYRPIVLRYLARTP